MIHVIEWTGKNLLEVIRLTGQNASASDYKWEDYERLVKDKGLKIFTPDGSVIASIGNYIINDNNECYILTKRATTMNKVFLGGTCAETTWRDELIKVLTVDYFNPVVEDWTPECIEIENNEKQNLCNIHFYIITKEMIGVYSIAEVVESAMTEGKATILQVMPLGFTDAQLKSLKAVISLVNSHGAIGFLDDNVYSAMTTLNAFK